MSGVGQDVGTADHVATDREKELCVLIVELLALATEGSSEWAAANRKTLVARARRVIEGLPEAIAEGEADYQAFCSASLDHQPEGTLEDLAMCARMIDRYKVDVDPANGQGQVSFARAMLESASRQIHAFLAKQA